MKALLGIPLHAGNTITAPFVGNGKTIIMRSDQSIRGSGKHLIHILVLEAELVWDKLKTGMLGLQLYFQLIQIKNFLLQNSH
jgi:hypothetical protein